MLKSETIKGSDWERMYARHLFANGWWALIIPKKVNGQQPFDILALKGSQILAVDCKVCSTDRFQFSRIEPDQWTAFASISSKTDAVCGFAILQTDSMETHWLGYDDAVKLATSGVKSIKLNEENSI